MAAETIDMEIDAVSCCFLCLFSVYNFFVQTTVVMAIVVDMAEAVMMIDAVVVSMIVVVVMMIVAVDMTIDAVADMMIDAVVADSIETAVMVAVEIGMMTDAVMMIDGTMTDVITIGMTHIRMVGEDTTEGATGQTTTLVQ